MRSVFRRVSPLIAVLILPIALAVAGPIDDLVGQVSLASYTDFLSRDDPLPWQLYTHDSDNRAAGGGQALLARATVEHYFNSFGLDTTTDAGVNVIGVKYGLLTPDIKYIVGAHYDSAGNPGADDDASGVAGVLEAARVLSAYKFAATLIFIAFDREELGLVGSWAYANAHSGDNILGMVSMDMIAWKNPAYPSAAIIFRVNSLDDPVANGLRDAFIQYVPAITPAVFDSGVPNSDHYPFHANGKPAALLIENSAGQNPYYHKPLDSVDTLGYIDYTFATNMTKGAVGYLATVAGLVQNESAVPEPSCVVLLVVFAAVRLRRRR